MRFLVDSSSSLGDVAIDVPLFRCIARNGHYLEVVVGAGVADALADCDFIDVVHSKGSSAVGKFTTYWKATRKPWDVILITRLWPSRYKPISFLGRTIHRRDRKYMDTSLYAKGAVIYRLSLLEGLIDNWASSIETAIPYNLERFALASNLAGIGQDEPYLTVAPGSAKIEKQWPVANFVDVIKEVRNSFAHVAVVGSPAEAQLCQQLASECGIVSLAGKLGLAETCALVSHSAQHLGNDSGLGHIAAGNGVATIAVGGHEDGHYAPWQQHMLRGPVHSITTAQVVAAMRLCESAIVSE